MAMVATLAARAEWCGVRISAFLSLCVALAFALFRTYWNVIPVILFRLFFRHVLQKDQLVQPIVTSAGRKVNLATRNICKVVVILWHSLDCTKAIECSLVADISREKSTKHAA